MKEINSKLNFNLTLKSDPLEDFNSASSVDFLVLIGSLDRNLLISLNEAARVRNICTSWSMSRGKYCYLLNDFLSFDLPSISIQFSSFSAVFARNSAKDHRNALIKSFNTLNEEEGKQ